MTALTALLILIVVMVIGVPIPLSFLASAAYICFVNGTDHLMLGGIIMPNTPELANRAPIWPAV